MASEIRIYFEGSPKLRNGFKKFFSKARAKVEAIGCGSRTRALKSFRNALIDNPEAFNILLVDSEKSVQCRNAWEHLHSLAADKLTRPDGAKEEHVHLMVQAMEAWFLADKDTLAAYYGSGFASNRLPTRQDIENIPKDDLVRSLNAAIESTKKKHYHKTVHAPELLERIDPAKVRSVSDWCDRLFNTIMEAL